MNRDFYSYGALTINALMSVSFYLSGGFVAARIAKQAFYVHALQVWLVSFLISRLLSVLFPGQYPALYFYVCALFECGATFAGAHLCAQTLQPRQG